MIKVKYPFNYLPMVKTFLGTKDIDASVTFANSKKGKVSLGVKRADDAITVEVKGSDFAEQSARLYLDSAESVLGGLMEKVNRVVEVTVVEDKPVKKAASKKKAPEAV